MASKENVNSVNDGEQQPVVDRDKVKVEREARRLAKLVSKQKIQDKSRNLPNDDEKKPDVKPESTKKVDNKKTSPKVETTAKNGHRKTEKHGKPNEKNDATIANDIGKLNINNDTDQPSANGAIEKPEKKQLSKSERRAIQEAQRAAKTGKAADKSAPQISKKENLATTKETVGAKPKPDNNTPSTSKENGARRQTPAKKPHQHRVKLFNHLYADTLPINVLSSSTIHPAIVRLGVQYSSGIVKGCNARGLAFMNAIKTVIAEYETPAQKEFSRSLEDVIKSSGNYLQQCRPLAVSVTNAMKFIQFQLRQLNKSESDAEVCFRLFDFVFITFSVSQWLNSSNFTMFVFLAAKNGSFGIY